MIRDLQQSLPDPALVADICVVGSGAAGIVLAVDLVRRGRSVLMLEAGGPDIEEPSQDPTGAKSSGSPITGSTPAVFVPKAARRPAGVGKSSSSTLSTSSSALTFRAAAGPFPNPSLRLTTSGPLSWRA